MAAVAFHFQANTISRSKGQSAVASVAYRTGQRLEDDRINKVFDYRAKGGVDFVHHAAPKEAPEWAQDIGEVWNKVEEVENRKNSTLAFEYVGAFPHQLTEQQREYVLKDFMREEFTRKGFLSTGAIHEPNREGDDRNHHAHIMICSRELDADGFAANKDRRFSGLAERVETLEGLKEKWAELGARQLEKAGFEIEAERWRHGYKTLQEQHGLAYQRGDIDYAEECLREPTKHIGVAAVAMERQGIETDRGNEHRATEARNEQRQQIKEEITSLERQETVLSIEPERVASRSFEQERDEQRPTIEPETPAREYPKGAAIIQDEPIKNRSFEQAAAQTAERLTPEELKRQQWEQEKEKTAQTIGAAWKEAERDPIQFAINLGAEGLTLATNEKGLFVAVDDKARVHYFTKAAIGDQAQEIQQISKDVFGGALSLPTVDELKAIHRDEKAAAWEAKREAMQQARIEEREIWIEQRQLDRTIDRIEAAQQKPQSATEQEIGRAWAESSTGAEFVQELQERGFLLCQVSKEEAAKSQNDRALLGTVAYQEGEFIALNQYGHASRVNAETISMTATNTYDHLQNVTERLESIEPASLLSLSQGRQVMDYFRETNDHDRHTGHDDERGADPAGLAAQGLGAALGAVESIAAGLEAFFVPQEKPAPQHYPKGAQIIQDEPIKSRVQIKAEQTKAAHETEISHTAQRDTYGVEIDPDRLDRIRRQWEEQENERELGRSIER